jgi:hypothetical protein
MKRAFAAIGIAIFAASASAQSAPSTADFVKTVAISRVGGELVNQ